MQTNSPAYRDQLKKDKFPILSYIKSTPHFSSHKQCIYHILCAAIVNICKYMVGALRCCSAIRFMSYRGLIRMYLFLPFPLALFFEKYFFRLWFPLPGYIPPSHLCRTIYARSCIMNVPHKRCYHSYQCLWFYCCFVFTLPIFLGLGDEKIVFCSLFRSFFLFTHFFCTAVSNSRQATKVVSRSSANLFLFILLHSCCVCLKRKPSHTIATLGTT